MAIFFFEKLQIAQLLRLQTSFCDKLESHHFARHTAQIDIFRTERIFVQAIGVARGEAQGTRPPQIEMSQMMKV